MATAGLQVHIHESKRGSLSMRVTGIADAQCKPLSDTVAEVTSALSTLPNMPALRNAVHGISGILIARCSYNSDRSCTVCHKTGRTAEEIAHTPSCAMGNMLRALKGDA